VEKAKKSAVLRTRRLSGKLLAFLLREEDETLRQFAAASKTGRAAKTLIKQGLLRITLVALKKGTALPRHRIAGPVSIQVVRGCLRLETEDQNIDVSADSLITLDAGISHTAKAHDDCGMLITFAIARNFQSKENQESRRKSFHGRES
jgi:quercetin dioxygenase-like cupin family protein